MSTLSKVDQAIAAIRYLFKKKKKKLDEMGRRVELSPEDRISMGEDWDLIRNVESVMKAAEGKMQEEMGKLPPQAIDMEEAVLGAMLLEKNAQTIIDILKPAHFYDERHRLIFQAMLDMFESDPIDMRSVVAKLRKQGTIEKVGGAHYIAELTSRVSSAANINYHAHILIEMAMRRQMILIAGKLLHDAYDDTVDTLVLLDEVNSEVKSINSWVK
jgi:hypothetical protein